jgi:hypothetical protein
MTDSEMTPDQRAEALIAEAARMIDRSIRHLPHGVSSNESKKLVELIVEAAVEWVMTEAPAPRCAETWQPAMGGDVGRCTLPTGHAGKHLMESRSGTPWVYPGEIDNEPNPDTWRNA